jgi:hypothetical protein
VAFNENEEPQELKIITELPGLQFEGEKATDNNLPNPIITPETPEHHEHEPDTRPEPEIILLSHTYPPRLMQCANIDYRTLNNPRARPVRQPWPEPLDIMRPTASSSTKQKSNDATAEIAIAFLFRQQESETEDDELKSLEAAKESAEWSQWNEAILEELNTLKIMGTWELVDLPEGRDPIRNRWIFVKKKDENGAIAQYKARLVAQGFTQKPGTDFSNTGTFAPVMRFETLQTILVMATTNDWELWQMDIKGAYLNGKIVEELYMKQPTGFEDGTAQVC